MSRRLTDCLAALALSLLLAGPCLAEDGHSLWLRYAPLSDDAAIGDARFRPTAIVPPLTMSATTEAAIDELERGLDGLLGQALPISSTIGDGAIVVGTAGNSRLIASLDLSLAGIGADGFVIRSLSVDGQTVTVVAANSDIGQLYGVFALLRALQTGSAFGHLNLTDAPRIGLRLLNHWDNLDGSVERGYAGRSLWNWAELPERIDERYRDYARANASIGINGTVLNNVNADALSLTAPYIAKAAALAAIFRPYGIRVYLSARFTAPIELGGLATADPLDPAVREWWRAKAAEIYAAIPDFGGFLVKANSEGQPGPADYGRSHAEGANMLAAALAPHGGVVMWRAFVYSSDKAEDRAKQAYNEFQPLDGRFADNVIVQVKNGPIDFQPREPFHPLFGAMPDTPLMLELQITKEYLGMASHLVYTGTLYEEVLDADTEVAGPGSTVARIVDGTLQGQRLTGIAGVANTGTDRDWTGSVFNQANWYAFGRLAWDPYLSAEAIAREWLEATFSHDAEFVARAAAMMLRSREAAVDYMTPLGLAHQMATGHHYGPGPWVDDLARPEWNPAYYHRADSQGIGFDRTASGSDAVAQYAAPVARRFSDLTAVDERYLLWFHHLPWDFRLPSGSTLWETLVRRYDRGVAAVERMQADWEALAPFVDEQRFARTAELLAIQRQEALWWRDASVAYFQSVSGLPLPDDVAPPEHPLAYYEAIRFDSVPEP